MNQRCVIVGASHCAAQLSISLRQQGWEGEIVVIGDEPYLPYHRPPLSKDFLAGAKGTDDILIRPANTYENAEVKFRLEARVTSIDREKRVVTLHTGEELGYDKLALTTGSKVREIPLPGVDKGGVYYLRTVADVRNIQEYAGNGRHAVIVGGGYIGLETAAVLCAMGMHVTVLEALPRVLQRVTAPEVSAFYTRVHREEGVTIVTDTVVDCIQGDVNVTGVACKNGATYPADLVIVGVGILPQTELAEKAGLEVENGIVVNEYAQTSDPNIVAAGDCSNHYNPIYGRRMRLESVQNATDQAKVAAATLCHKLEAYNALPWFWSDQYDLKLQIAGMSQGYDQVVIRGDIEGGRSFAAFYLQAGKLLAVDAVNRPKEFMATKRLIIQGTSVDAGSLADESFILKNLVSKAG